jgi:predicted PhzF superfamily epimerase YddE/YHI9
VRTARVRIFTPRAEMPFAGHPNVGTAFVLAHQDAVCGASFDRGNMVFEEIAGLVRMRVKAPMVESRARLWRRPSNFGSFAMLTSR